MIRQRLGCVLVALALLAVPAWGDGSMSAVRASAYGGPQVLKLETVAKPTPAANQVLIRVHAAAVNPVDWKIRAGQIKGMSPPPPMILGQDVSGVVDSVGPGVTAYKPGDEVFAYVSLRRGGGYAEYAIAEIGETALKPAKIDHVHAAAVPLAALTAWQALVDKAGLKEGQSVLIHAAAGGVGHFAVQIAKARGARVIATASERNHAFLKELGADVCVDYRQVRFEDVAKDVDVVLDSIGGETQTRSIAVLKEGGVLVSIVQSPDQAALQAKGARGLVFLVSPSGTQLASLAKMIDEGKLKPYVSDILPLAEAAKAHELSESGRTRGKIVLKVVE